MGHNSPALRRKSLNYRPHRLPGQGHQSALFRVADGASAKPASSNLLAPMLPITLLGRADEVIE
jgi:hypothetical protein